MYVYTQCLRKVDFMNLSTQYNRPGYDVIPGCIGISHALLQLVPINMQFFNAIYLSVKMKKKSV